MLDGVPAQKVRTASGHTRCCRFLVTCFFNVSRPLAHTICARLSQVCRTLCVQFAEACNGSDSVLARCADDLLYDEQPCTDYADLSPARYTRFPADSLPGSLPNISSSPAELFQTVSGLPLLITVVVLLLHLCCCVVQSACGRPMRRRRRRRWPAAQRASSRRRSSDEQWWRRVGRADRAPLIGPG